MSTLSDALLAPPASLSRRGVAFVLIHTYLSRRSLCCARNIVLFADLALAPALGAGRDLRLCERLFADEASHGFAYALLFTAIGAALLTMTPGASLASSAREAFVGILYVVATGGNHIGYRSLAAGGRST